MLLRILPLQAFSVPISRLLSGRNCKTDYSSYKPVLFAIAFSLPLVAILESIASPAPQSCKGFTNAVLGSCLWFERHNEKWKQNAAHCRPHLLKAKTLQEQAFSKYDGAKKPGLSNIQRSRLVAQGNALIKERGNELKDFTDCANQANRHGAGIDDPSCPLPNLYHLRLYKEPWLDDKTLLQKLVKAKAKFQSNQLGRGKPIAFDEYSIDIVRMPYGLKPERLLQLLASDLNGTLIGGNAGDLFSRVNYFKRREKGLPQLGELVDIRIPGDPSLHNIMSDDGTVQLVELTSDRFTYQTVTTPETGAHPENGARTFGFRRLGNSTVRFYTYGASRPNNESLQLPGWAAQETGWRSLVTAIGELVNRLGGEADFGRTRANRFNQKCD